MPPKVRCKSQCLDSCHNRRCQEGIWRNTKHFRSYFLLTHPPLTLAKGSWRCWAEEEVKQKKVQAQTVFSFWPSPNYESGPMLRGKMIRWNEKLKLSFELDILTHPNVWLLHYSNRTGKPWDLPGVGKEEFSRVCLKRVLERKYKAVADCTLPSWVNTANIFCCIAAVWCYSLGLFWGRP